MTIRPYVALYYTWDSNVDSSTRQGSYSSFNINPGFTFAYKADNWSLQGGAYYQYHAYTENADNLNQGSWGENLAFNWTNSKDGGKGWSLVLRENLQYITQDDDAMSSGGRGIGRDRLQLRFAGAIQRRFTEKLHGDINASYYYLNYDNDQSHYAPLYGWTRWTVGAQAGYAASRWTDLLLMGTYQDYTQENDRDLSQYQSPNPARIGGGSQGATVHVGIGSYATEKISYRLTGGWSFFRYGDGISTDNGFTYTGSAHWRMNDTWNMMFLASSYYQPDETNYGSASRRDSLSWGIAHSMVRNKLTANFDIVYSHQSRCQVVYQSSDITDDTITGRLGLNYTLNRFLAIFGNVEYQTSFANGDHLDRYNYNYDYDRWRLSIGLRLTY